MQKRYTINRNEDKFNITDRDGKVVGSSKTEMKARKSIAHRTRASREKAFVERSVQLRDKPKIITVRNKKKGV